MFSFGASPCPCSLKAFLQSVIKQKPIFPLNEIVQYVARLYYALTKLMNYIQWSVKNAPIICQNTQYTFYHSMSSCNSVVACSLLNANISIWVGP